MLNGQSAPRPSETPLTRPLRSSAPKELSPEEIRTLPPCWRINIELMTQSILRRAVSYLFAMAAKNLRDSGMA